jgi:hypothetical protein
VHVGAALTSPDNIILISYMFSSTDLISLPGIKA